MLGTRLAEAGSAGLRTTYKGNDFDLIEKFIMRVDRMPYGPTDWSLNRNSNASGNVPRQFAGL
jgi:hypothetical protein